MSLHTPILERLRTETAPIHRQLEALPLSQILMSPSIRLEEYAAYLAATYGLLDYIETRFFSITSEFVPDAEERKRAAFIVRDLESIGHLPANLAAKKSEEPFLSYFQYPLSETLPYALGVMYVTEGSTLGGRVILKNLSGCLDLNAAAGASYFAGYGDSTGLKWKTFLQALNTYAEGNRETEVIVKGAVDAFHAFYHVLSFKQP